MSDSESSDYSSSSISGLSLASEELMIGRLSSELQAKVAELNTDIHPDLGPFLLRYADALLTKEEDHLNPFEAEPEAEAEPGAEGETSDVEVAWECLEQARLCFEKAGDSARADLAFVHQRLGDLLTMQGAAEAAAEEYKKALSFLGSDESRARAGVLMVLGQALLMAQKYVEGRKYYAEAEAEFKAWRTRTEKEEELEIIDASMAEIEDALKDCDLAIRAILGKKTSETTKVEEKKEAVTGVFDKATTDQSAKVITLVPKRKTQTEESPDAKKPRLA